MKPKLTNKCARKENDNIPECGVSCESNFRGPTTKNLLIPKALAITLKMKVTIGIASVKLENISTELP